MRRRFLIVAALMMSISIGYTPSAHAGGFLKKLFGKSEPACCEPAPEPTCCEPAPEPTCCEPAPEPTCCEPAPEPAPVCCEPAPEPAPKCCEAAPAPACCEPAPEPAPCCTSAIMSTSSSYVISSPNAPIYSYHSANALPVYTVISTAPRHHETVVKVPANHSVTSSVSTSHYVSQVSKDAPRTTYTSVR